MPLELTALLVFCATIVERLVELVISRRNATLSFKQGGVEYGAEHYSWMVVMHTLFLICMLVEYSFWGPEIEPELRYSAVIVALICQVFRWWIIRTLGPQWNTRVIIVPGMERVRTGPYKFLDHPNYVVVAVETLALPLIFGAWRTALIFSVLNALMMRVRINVENMALRGLR